MIQSGKQLLEQPQNCNNFLCASNWMRDGLVDYARVARPLQKLLDAALTRTFRSKRAASGIAIELTEAEITCFEEMKNLLANSAMLTYPDSAK